MSFLPQLAKSWDEQYPKDRFRFRILPREDEPDEDEPDEDESPVTRTRTSNHSTTRTSTGSTSTNTGHSSALDASNSQTNGAQPTDANGNPTGGRSRGPNKGGIAAGVILAIATILAIFGLIQLRRRRKKKARRVYTVRMAPAAPTGRRDMESRGESLTPMLSSARTTYRDVSGTASTRETHHEPMHEEGMRSQETLRTLPNPWPDARPHSALDRNPSGRIVHRESLSSEKTSRNSLSPSESTVAYSPIGKAQMSWLSEIPEGSSSANEQSKGLPPLPTELPPAYSQRV